MEAVLLYYLRKQSRTNSFSPARSGDVGSILKKQRLLYVYWARANFVPRFVIEEFGLLQWRCFHISNKELQINEEIRDKEIRVIDADGSQLGIISTKDAMKIAIDKNLDLVKIAPQAAPPVCRIMDYGKYRFEQAKQEKEAKKNQKVIEIKEVRLSLNIDTNDFNTKVNHAIKFLKDGNKVKVSVRFRGREMAHSQMGTVLMQRFTDAVAEVGTVEKQPKMEGRSMTMFISAKPVK